ncbi:MAG TPA: STAS/SEC14 domain-containing protein [Ktedonobacterales bacterium]|jgi:hypothetical protein
MIEQLSEFPQNVLGFRASGHVTRQDYDSVVDPAVEAAFKSQQSLRLYYQLDSDFRGMEPGAMWEDFKIGMEHIRHWERIAIVTDVDWIGNSIKVFGFLIPGEVRLFALAQADQARAWIVGSDAHAS